MLTSSRNTFKGIAKSLKKGVVNDEIVLQLAGGTEITAIITDTSTQNLGLKKGVEAIALVKTSWVILAANLDGIKLSARNQLKGTVKEVRHGAVNDEVIVTLAGGEELVAVITVESTKKLGLEKGKPVTALIKASHVLIGVAA